MYATILIALAAGASLVIQTATTSFRRCICGPFLTCNRRSTENIEPASTECFEDEPSEPDSVFCSVDCREMSVIQ